MRKGVKVRESKKLNRFCGWERKERGRESERAKSHTVAAVEKERIGLKFREQKVKRLPRLRKKRGKVESLGEQKSLTVSGVEE